MCPKKGADCTPPRCFSATPSPAPSGDAWMFSMQPSFGLPWCSTLEVLLISDLLWLHSTVRVNRDCLRRALVAQQPAQGSGMQARPGGSRRPLVSRFRPSSCLHYISGLLCARFLHFPQAFPFPTMLHFLTQGLRSSDITARCLSAHLLPCAL